MSRARQRFAPAWKTLVAAAGIALAAASVAVLPPESTTTKTLAAGSDTAESSTGPSRGGRSREAREIRGSSGVAGSKFVCARGRNGGATDDGVTPTKILLGATVVDSGLGATFLRDARYSMISVKNAVNAAGGICGRHLDLILIDDGWKFDLGGQFLRNLVEDKKVFALAVVPSSEGLKSVSDAGYLQRMGVPVVGSDGMLIHQYTDPMIWPIAASTMSSMRIAAKAAHDRGARHFAMVYESDYHFGREGAYAFNAAVERLTKHEIPGYSDPLKGGKCLPHTRFCGISSAQGNYGEQVNNFNQACTGEEPKCDFVAMLLEPATALGWLNDDAINPGVWGTIDFAGPQPLFTRTFAEECGRRCNGLWLWTGYQPPIGANLSRPGIASFVRDIKSTNFQADYANTFVQGAYLGMNMLVQALGEVGPELTRERLIAVLDGFSFDSDLLLSPLRWRKGDHFANSRMKAYSITYTDRFGGWRDERTEMDDPWVGKDIVDS